MQTVYQAALKAFKSTAFKKPLLRMWEQFHFFHRYVADVAPLLCMSFAEFFIVRFIIFRAIFMSENKIQNILYCLVLQCNETTPHCFPKEMFVPWRFVAIPVKVRASDIPLSPLCAKLFAEVFILASSNSDMFLYAFPSCFSCSCATGPCTL